MSSTIKTIQKSFIGTIILYTAVSVAPLAYASAWNPTLLVNTEAFQIIDEGDGASDVFIQFGDALSETLTFDRTNNRFSFSDDVNVIGDINVTGTMSGESLYVSGTGGATHPLISTDVSTGRIGFGTVSPDADFEILKNGIPQQYISAFNNFGGGQITFRRAQGTDDSPSALEFGNVIGGIAGVGYGTTAFSPNRASISFAAAEDWTDAVQGTEIRFNVTQSGSTTGLEAMRITGDGNIGINQSDPETTLDVAGSISGSTLTASALQNCDTIDTDSSGNMICGTDDDTVPEIVIAEYSDTTGGVDLNVSTAIAINWNNEIKEDPGFTHSSATNPSRVTLDEANWYRITYSVSHENQSVNRKNIRCRVRMNGSTFLDQSNSYTYSRDNTDEWGTNNATFIVETTSASEYYEVLCNGEGTGVDTESTNSVANESWTLVERINIRSGAAAAFRDTAGGTDVNVSTPAAMSWNNETREDVGFTHSTATNPSRVTLDNADWYRITYSVSHEVQVGGRKNIRCRVRLNGSTFVNQSNSYSYSRNITDEWATNKATFIVQTVNPNEYYEVLCNGEGSNVDAQGANTVGNASWTLVERLSKVSGANAQYSDTSGGADVNVASPVAVAWNSELREDVGFRHSGGAGSNTGVYLDDPDWYRITYSVSHENQSLNFRKNIRCRVRMNGSTFIDYSNSYSYSRTTTDEWATNHATFVIQTTAEDEYLEVMCNGEGASVGTESANTVANESWVLVEKIGMESNDGFDSPGVVYMDTATSNATGAGFQSLKSFTLPGETLGTNGAIRIVAWVRRTGGAGAGTFRFTYGGTSIAQMSGGNANNPARVEGLIMGAGATNSQRGYLDHLNSGTTGSATGTAAADSTINQTVGFEVDLATDSDTFTCDYILVERVR